MKTGQSSKKGRGVVGAVLALVLAVGPVAPFATASVAPSTTSPDEGQGTLRLLPGALPVAEATPGHSTTRQLWLWPDGRRGYQVDQVARPAPGALDQVRGNPPCVPPEHYPSAAPPNRRCPVQPTEVPNTTEYELVAYDLDSREEVARSLIEPTLDVGSAAIYGGGHSHMGAVDPHTGRVFLPYQSTAVEINSVNAQTPGQIAGPLAQGSETCTPGGTPSRCTAGILVIDGTSLATVRRIPLRSISVDGGALRPSVRTMAWAPAGPSGPGKLYLVVDETVHVPLTGDHSVPGKGGNLAYLIQIDPETGRQDWAVRLDSCRYSRDKSNDAADTMHRPRPYAVFRGSEPGDPAIWVACHTGSGLGGVVRVPLDAAGNPSSLPFQVVQPDPATTAPEDVSPAEAVSTRGGQEVYPGPDGAVEMLADPVSERFAMRVIAGDPEAEVWWLFDARKRTYVGTVGIGPLSGGTMASVSALDMERGRLYVFVPPYPGVKGGMYIADIRRTPLPQALVFPELASLHESFTVTPSGDVSDSGHTVAMSVDPGDEDRPARVYWRHGDHTVWRVIEDTVPVSADSQVESFGGRTLDLDEVEGVTSTAYDAAARGYGARMLLVAGAEAAGRVGPVDPTVYYGADDATGPITQGVPAATPVHELVQTRAKNPCAEADRELVLAAVGGGNPAVVDMTGGRGSAKPLAFDSTLAADMEGPYSRCGPYDWQETFSLGLIGKPPADEPTVSSDLLFGKNEASCLSSNEAPQDQTDGGLMTGALGDPVATPLAASVECSPDEVSGWSQARLTQLGDFAMTSAYASFRLYRDPGRGIVARIESVARGVGLQGAFKIDSIRSVAESWANGRKQPVPAADRDPDYNANCDAERTAGTCFKRHLFGVWTPGYQCGPCGDERRLEAVLTKAMGAQGKVALRAPDPVAARGAENGFAAAISKPDHERFSDLVLNNDLLQTVVPGLEIVRYAPPGQQLPGTGARRARQIYQFAGVEASTSYGISCQLIYDEATNTCAGEKQEPGAIQVSLSDPDGKALAGGAFEVRADVDADGVLGLKDTLLPDGACVTTDDGVGTCKFESLQPGSYLVNQVAAPPGYAKSAEPFVVELASGEQRTVAFTNVSNLSTVDLKATDENGAPVSGAVFAAYPDPDSDGKVAPDAKPAAECTTGADGACSMKVPAGSYVLVQTSAPAGLEGIEPVAFTFASGGQVAAVTVVNYPPEQPAAPEAPASPVVDYTPPVDYSPPVESVTDYAPVDTGTDVVAEPEPPVLAQVGDTITQVIRAPGDALRLLARDPKEAVAWTAALALFCLAVMAIRRRQQAMALMQG